MKKLFHISDVLSVATGLMVSSRGMNGIYDIVAFLVGEEKYSIGEYGLYLVYPTTRENLKERFPALAEDSPYMSKRIEEVVRLLADSQQIEDSGGKDYKSIRIRIVEEWVEQVRQELDLPEMIEVEQIPVEDER